MTRHASPATPDGAGGGNDSTAAAERGMTDISTQVVEKLAVRLATEVPGVVDRPLSGCAAPCRGFGLHDER